MRKINILIAALIILSASIVEAKNFDFMQTLGIGLGMKKQQAIKLLKKNKISYILDNRDDRIKIPNPTSKVLGFSIDTLLVSFSESKVDEIELRLINLETSNQFAKAMQEDCDYFKIDETLKASLDIDILVYKYSNCAFTKYDGEWDGILGLFFSTHINNLFIYE